MNDHIEASGRLTLTTRDVLEDVADTTVVFVRFLNGRVARWSPKRRMAAGQGR